MTRVTRIFCLLLAILILFRPRFADSQKGTSGWQSDWSVEDSFSLRIDTEGFQFPTSIAFVPNPGTAPDDPLYFVTELRGTVKVVTNNRKVHVFAQDFFRIAPAKELPSEEGEIGMAGICVEPNQGYVFVTFAYHDQNGILRNNIVRFTTTPHTFALKPSAQVAFTGIFAAEESGTSHQIGNCQVSGNFLYVGVGEGHRSYQSRRVQSTLGKVLRMTLDGNPVPDNPYYENDDVLNPRNYVYALGFRNPFGIRYADQRLFAVDNGPSIDRFLEISRGGDYLWDGSNYSIGVKAASTITPSVGLVQMDYCSEKQTFLPEELRKSFVVAVSGQPNRPGTDPPRGILLFPYDFDKNAMAAVPRYLVKYRGSGYQSVTGVAVGPDALYFSPLFPDEENRSFILKLAHEPAHAHPFTLRRDITPMQLLSEKGCLDCHSFDRGKQSLGPNLSKEDLVSRISKRLQSSEYRQSVERLRTLNQEPYNRYIQEREEVLRAKGLEQVRIWMIHHLMDPRFDNPGSAMPNLQLSHSDAVKLTDYLTGAGTITLRDRLYFRLVRFVPLLRYRHLLYAFCLGIPAGALLIFVAAKIRARFRRPHLPGSTSDFNKRKR